MEKYKGVPLYLQVAETIRGRILDNYYQPGELIPPVRELEIEFEVSNITVRKALDLLNKEGLLESRQGVGAKVAERLNDLVHIQITGNFREWLDSASGRTPKLQAHVLETCFTHGPKRVHELLGLPVDKEIFRMKRVRKLKGQSVSYYVNYCGLEECRNLNISEVEKRSFIEVFQETCGIRLKRIEQRVQAITADIDLSTILKTEFGAPLFFAENAYYAEGETPVQLTQMYYRGDRYVYSASIQMTESG